MCVIHFGHPSVVIFKLIDFVSSHFLDQVVSFIVKRETDDILDPVFNFFLKK